MQAEISIPAAVATDINNLLAGKKSDTKETITFTAHFEDGCEADIKIVTDADTPYIDPVLFDKNGLEIMCLQDGSEHVEGTYQFNYYEKIYIVEIRID